MWIPRGILELSTDRCTVCTTGRKRWNNSRTTRGWIWDNPALSTEPPDSSTVHSTVIHTPPRSWTCENHRIPQNPQALLLLQFFLLDNSLENRGCGKLTPDLADAIGHHPHRGKGGHSVGTGRRAGGDIEWGPCPMARPSTHHVSPRQTASACTRCPRSLVPTGAGLTRGQVDTYGLWENRTRCFDRASRSAAACSSHPTARTGLRHGTRGSNR